MSCIELNIYWFASFKCPLMVFQYQMQLMIYFTMLSRKSKRFSQCLRRPCISTVQCSTGQGVRLHSIYWGWAGGPQTLHLRCCNLTNELKIVRILESGNACLTIWQISVKVLKAASDPFWKLFTVSATRRRVKLFMQWFLYCLEENKTVSTRLSSTRVKYCSGNINQVFKIYLLWIQMVMR